VKMFVGGHSSVPHQSFIIKNNFFIKKLPLM
jgi:poly-gamma-glutamate capsule biosynthesis protein CapA/YwtB (metallophosphatase superfamily)